jgi:hypothetical protein
MAAIPPSGGPPLQGLRCIQTQCLSLYHSVSLALSKDSLYSWLCFLVHSHVKPLDVLSFRDQVEHPGPSRPSPYEYPEAQEAFRDCAIHTPKGVWLHIEIGYALVSFSVGIVSLM